MLRLPLRSLPACRRHALSQIARNASTQASESSPSKARSTSLLFGLGSGALIASYFLWPDQSRAAPTKKNSLLSPTHFTPVEITETEPCPDPNTRLMTLTVPRQSIPSLNETAFQPIWSIYIKDDDIQVERPFTPLEGMDSEGRMKFWIKRYERGEVGRWLHSKKVGDKIEIRGPLKTWPWQEGEWDEVVMISGGTGITPFYQLIHKELLSQASPKSKTRFTLLHSSRRPTELPPAELLRPLLAYSQAHPDKLNLRLFVDSSEGPSHPAAPSSTLAVGRIGRAAIEDAMGAGSKSWWRSLFGASSSSRSLGNEAGKKVMFLVCGPDPMVAAIAGPFGRNFSQGDVGGALGELGYDKASVWKL
ncbi:ferredoxin reductase-like C-terminal NADP-linked domain-containing protein [Trametes versicolor FP-101664 SS1]|uniref:ferredoxin reductase-like C-terminal NADP-linked domain-containing protein n=1 Tax=Trametes versicolor (strain FP-101664) TaxID=717944 RepID=UPI0004623122|nr:ferredoxin reductase-like C-terminal NADP-linked domain-containing protein [Trametes versicolor FP-101664 SS1]EIW62055.1 ferredoxin reductase-like C-terminal NADP-linked domain-containing protein [Trametes versicolor FP-101664 SS1]